MPGSVWAFCPNKKEMHYGDYLKVFHSDNYLRWFEQQLIPNLSKPSLIVLDNAKYYKWKPINAPNASRMRKTDVIAELIARGIPHDNNISAFVAKILLRNWINANIKSAIEILAESHGHQVFSHHHTSATFNQSNYCGLVSKVKSVVSIRKTLRSKMYGLDCTNSSTHLKARKAEMLFVPLSIMLTVSYAKSSEKSPKMSEQMGTGRKQTLTWS